MVGCFVASGSSWVCPFAECIVKEPWWLALDPAPRAWRSVLSCVRCSTAFSRKDGSKSVVAEENRSESWPNATRSLLYSPRMNVLLSTLHWEEAFPMKVRAAFTVVSTSSTIIGLSLLMLSSRPMRGPAVSRNSAWMQEWDWSADLTLFEHSVAISLSRRGGVVKGHVFS